jgi:rifampicin phosphotransferase
MGAMNTTAPVIALDTPAALDVARVGRKAANLAAARAAGLPVAPGVVLTADWSSDDQATALQVWRIISHDGARPLVVRPSANGRERRPAPGSGAGEPVTVVRDGDGLLRAIAGLRAADACLPVLVQPHVAGAWQGVLFADDAGGGWRARPVVVATPADGPEWTAEIDHAGRVRDVLSAPAAAPPAQLLGRLARLADRVAAAFDGPHDLEWVVADDGRIQLLRVRPVVRLHVAGGARPSAPQPTRVLVGSAA